MEISIKLPNNLYEGVSHLAKTKKKSVATIIKSALQKAVTEAPENIEEQAKQIRQSIQFCSDTEILALANLQTPEDKHLSNLFEKNREGVLTKKEHAELAVAVAQSRINDLRKAFGILEAKKRGLM